MLAVPIGALMGLSLGIATHLLEADTVIRHLPLTCACAVFGVPLAVAIKYAIRGAWYRVGQDYYLRCARTKWGAMLGEAILRSLLLTLVDVAMERQGLLALMQLQADTQALTGHAVGRSPWRK